MQVVQVLHFKLTLKISCVYANSTLSLIDREWHDERNIMFDSPSQSTSCGFKTDFSRFEQILVSG